MPKTPDAVHAREAVKRADAAKKNVARSTSKGHAKYNWLALIVAVATSTLAGERYAAIGALVSIALGILLMKGNYNLPSRQTGWRATDTFIALLTIALPIAVYTSGAIVGTDGHNAAAFWCLLLVLVVALTYGTVKIGRRIAR